MMKYCMKCGSELFDEAVICPKCGCTVSPNNQTTQYDREKASKSAVTLGIIGIVMAWLFALVGHITSIIAICIGISDCIKKKKSTGLILGIIGEVCSVFSSIIGAVALSSLF